MSGPNWMSYVGMITGLIGTATGIAGALVGYASYKKTKQIKSLDLRLELKREVVNARSSYSELCQLMEKADGQRKRTASLTGNFQSSWIDKWKKKLEDDKNRIKELEKTLPDDKQEYGHLSAKELESALVKIHEINAAFQSTSKSYAEAYEDKATGKRVVEERRIRLGPNT